VENKCIYCVKITCEGRQASASFRVSTSLRSYYKELLSLIMLKVISRHNEIIFNDTEIIIVRIKYDLAGDKI
jgi:L-cysteine desulfidase